MPTPPPPVPGRMRRSTVVLLVAVLLLGVALRSVHALAPRSLWVDEISLALDVEERSMAELVGEPLRDHFVAPTGYLVLTKLAVETLGPSEAAHRLVSYLGALVALPLFVVVARRFLEGPALVLVAALTSLSPALTWYGGAAKQYSTDFVASMAVVGLALRWRDGPRTPARGAAVGASGLVLLILSQTAVLVAAAVGTLLVLEAVATARRRDLERGPALSLALLGGGWTLGALTVRAITVRTVPEATREFMYEFWKTSFAPPPWESLESLLWFPDRILRLLSHFLLYVEVPDRTRWLLMAAPAALALVGFAALVRRRPWPTAFLVAPFLAAVVGAVLQFFPFRGRLVLYATWPLVVLVGAGVQALAGRWPRRRVPVLVTAAVLLVAPPAWTTFVTLPPPIRTQEAAPVLAEVARLRHPDDVVYVYCGALKAARYYGPRVGLGPWVPGGCYGDRPDLYLAELDAAAAGHRRLWLVVTLTSPVFREPEIMRAHLDTLGREIGRIPDPYGLEAHNASTASLYELDPARVAPSSE